MGSLLLCNQKIAKNPYFFRNTMTNIYSIEELCYYIYNNVYLIDESIMNNDLVRWIREETGYTFLADELSQIIKSEGTLALFTERILSSTAYYESDKIAEVRGVITELSNKSEFYRKKIKADNLLEKKKYSKAILEYYKVLECKRDAGVNDNEIATVYHNIGVCYAKAMLFLDASDYFAKAYELNHNEESFEQLNLAKKLLKENDLYDYGENESSDILKRIEEISYLKESGQLTQYYNEIGIILENWKTEYRINME